jgi:hypothetical protein
MSELKFTPGPWRLPTPEEGKRWLARYLILDAEGGSLADATPGFPANHETKIANARLMTAAPDLLEALRDCADYFHDFTEVDKEETRLAAICRAAIAKATGE